MPTHTEFKHGSFSWVDLATTDADAAKTFYGGLFGWKFDDRPAGPGMTYSMAKVGESVVGALYEMGAEMAGIPPHWASYVTVDDVDATTKKAAQNGGKTLKEPFDVMTFGRMSVVQDPTGATLCLWQAKAHHGASLTGEPGSSCWFELYTNNVDAAGKFYVQTLGWDTEAMDMGPMGVYTLFGRKGEGKQGQVGGMMKMPPGMEGVPPHWLPYFAAADTDASAKKAGELGGKIVMPPMDIPNIGRFSIVEDPQGAVFALYTSKHGG